MKEKNKSLATSFTQSLTRIWGVVMRHMYLYIRSLDRLSDSVYWPVMDIVVWGVTSRWMMQNQTGIPDLVLMILTGLVFWQIVWRANYEISVNLLEEFWNQNLVNLFSTPLTVYEWILSVMILGFIKMILTAGVGIIAVWLLYSLNIFTVGWMIIPFAALLLLSGWFMGFLGAAFIMYYGNKVQTLAWTMGFMFAPFSAVYYPLSSLPNWIQNISKFLPTTYVFEGMRSIINDQGLPLDMLLKSLGLNILYLTLAISFFVFMFEKSRGKGLARLE